MHPVLNAYLAESLAADRLAEAERARAARAARPRPERDPVDTVTVRRAGPRDGAEVAPRRRRARAFIRTLTAPLRP